MTNDDDDGAWVAVFSVDTPLEDVEHAIEEQIEIARDAFRTQLDAHADLTRGERAALLAHAEPYIRTQTRQAMWAGWRRLHQEAQTSGTIH
jgi:hypothetical protein